MQTKELKNLRAKLDSMIAESEKAEKQQKKKDLSSYNTKLGLLESVSKILDKCDYSTSGILEFAKPYYQALTDPKGPREERIYETFMNGLENYTFLEPVQTELNLLKNRVKKNKQNIDLAELLDIMKDSSSFYLVDHIEDAVINYMDSKNASTRVQLLSAINPYLYDPFVKQIYAMVNSDMTKDEYLHESYKPDQTLESLESIGSVVARNVITPVIALDSTLSALKLGPKWVTLRGRMYSEVAAITDIPEEEYQLGNLLNDTDKVFIDFNTNRIYYSLINDIANDETPITITDYNTILFEDNSYTADEFALINNARMEPLQLVDITNVCLIASHFDDLAYLDNTVEYVRPEDNTESLQVFITTFRGETSEPEYSVIVSNKVDSTYDIYNNLDDIKLVDILNKTFETNIVAITESSKDSVNERKKEFKKKCAEFESSIKDLELKKKKLEELMSKFESDELADSIDSITDDINKYEDEYLNYQKKFNNTDPDNETVLGGPDNDKTTIKGISFQNEVEPDDVSEPLNGDVDPSTVNKDVASLDAEAGPDELEYDTVPDEYDDYDDYEDTESPDSADSFDDVSWLNDDNSKLDSLIGPDDDYSDEDLPDYTNSDYDDLEVDESNDINVDVFFSKDVDNETKSPSFLIGQVSVNYPVVDPITKIHKRGFINAAFSVDANTGDPEKDINLWSNDPDRPIDTIPDNVYHTIVETISSDPTYTNTMTIANAAASASGVKSVQTNPEFDKYLDNTGVRMDGPIKSMVIEGIQNNKKITMSIKLNEAADDVTEPLMHDTLKAPIDREDLDSAEGSDEIPVETFEADDTSILAMLDQIVPSSELTDANISISDIEHMGDDPESAFYDVEAVRLVKTVTDGEDLDDESDIIDDKETYLFKINYNGEEDPEDSDYDMYNTIYAVKSEQPSGAFEFLNMVANGNIDIPDLKSLVINSDEENEAPVDPDLDEYGISLVKVNELSDIAETVDFNYYGDIDPEEGEALDEAVKLILDDSKESDEDTEDDIIADDELESLGATLGDDDDDEDEEDPNKDTKDKDEDSEDDEDAESEESEESENPFS